MKENYGKKFKEERMRLRLKQSDIKDAIGLCTASISARENGKRQWRAKELYRAYMIFGIDVGFGKTFEAIDQEEYNESIFAELTKREQKAVKEKDYDTMAIWTLRSIKKLLSEQEMFLAIDLTDEEEKQLRKILRYYKRKDGNIERALKLLVRNAK